MSKKELLFELARRIVHEESGDGCVAIISRKYDILAKDFLKYEMNLENPIFVRQVETHDSTVITFAPKEEYSQEAIVFALDIGIRSIEMYDSVFFLNL